MFAHDGDQPATDSTNKRKATRIGNAIHVRRSVHDAVKNSGDLLHFRCQFRELLGQDRLHTVRKRFLRVMMHFHKQSICADGHRGTGEGSTLWRSRAVAWSTRMGKWLRFFTAGTTARSSVLREKSETSERRARRA